MEFLSPKEVPVWQKEDASEYLVGWGENRWHLRNLTLRRFEKNCCSVDNIYCKSHANFSK